MIKKVKIEDLRPGMFIERFDCKWTQHPFIFNHKKITSFKTIDRLNNWGVTHVFINTDQGLNASESPPPKPELHLKLTQQTSPEQMRVAKEIHHIPLHHEIARAKRIREKANQAAHEIMRDVQCGKKIKTEEAYNVITEMDNSICHSKDALLLLMRVRSKDEYTFEHSVGVCALLLAFCRSLGLDDETTRLIGLGGLLHDVGKMAIPMDILNKPAALNNDEFEKVKHHVIYCREILANTHNIPHTAALIASQHHERFDGSGYPYGLVGDEISNGGQMAAIVDVFDALTSDRCYRQGIDQVEVLKKIYEWGETHFNQELSQRFIKCIGIYPVGTVVQLESGFIGVVAESTDHLLQPVVRIIHDTIRDRPVSQRDIDLSRPESSGGDRIVGYESVRRWRINPYKILGIT
ncbi:MAG: HD-GYP domain-containing protein [Desulfobulbaceae bacterium]|nr:HD-GYP domain-containing protein [Desulfobulbaceae bacterium]HIJ79165.1 HD-GYP domain-containing protein [Deltaproteobacteria bacterium]